MNLHQVIGVGGHKHKLMLILKPFFESLLMLYEYTQLQKCNEQNLEPLANVRVFEN